jgi:carbohydrate kinase (thermoresistant glucokinase family)
VAGQPPPILVLMGVAGSGKSTIGGALAARLGCAFQEGDALHPARNIAKMASGHPLDDADRAPWLRAVAGVIDGWRAAGVGGVITCSALRHSYREAIIGQRPGVRLVYLEGDAATLRARLTDRHGHFMPAALLDSQLATLEPPGADEHPIVVDIHADAVRQVETVLAALGDG